MSLHSVALLILGGDGVSGFPGFLLVPFLLVLLVEDVGADGAGDGSSEGGGVGGLVVEADDVPNASCCRVFPVQIE